MAAPFRLSSERNRATSRLAIYRRSIRLGAKPLKTHDQLFFSSKHLWLQSSCNILSNERMGLSFTIATGLASAVILGSKSCGTHDHILLSQSRDFPNREGEVPIFISPGTGLPSCCPRHWVPFSSPPTTRRAIVEVFEPAFTRGN
jgi:hypothetical protein